MIQDERTALWPYESLGLPTHWPKRKRTYVFYTLPIYDFDLRATHARTLDFTQVHPKISGRLYDDVTGP